MTKLVVDFGSLRARGRRPQSLPFRHVDDLPAVELIGDADPPAAAARGVVHVSAR